MINTADKRKIITLAKKYKVRSVYLFGSATGDLRKARDIDLGIDGIEARFFFKMYGELMRALSKPVDLVDLSKKNRFNKRVEERGIKLYG